MSISRRKKLHAILVLALLAGGSLQEAPAAESALRDGLQGCLAIAADTARLRCYDALAAGEGRTAAPQAATRQETPARSAAAPPRDAAPARELRAGGDEARVEKPSQRAEEAAGESLWRVRAATHNAFTGWTIEFDNGQVWRQVGTEKYTIEVGASYLVRSGIFNSFFLSSPGHNQRIRIRRDE